MKSTDAALFRWILGGHFLQLLAVNFLALIKISLLALLLARAQTWASFAIIAIKNFYFFNKVFQ